jgi:hypothetical protein
MAAIETPFARASGRDVKKNEAKNATGKANYYTSKFSQRPQTQLFLIMAAAFDERYSHHEDHEGHEDRITEGSKSEKHIFFLRALRVLRGKIQLSVFSILVAAALR